MDLGIAPTQVLPCQTHNQLFERRVRARSSTAVLALERPLPSNEVAMPAQHGLRLVQAHNVTELTDASSTDRLKFRGENGQHQLLAT